MSDSLERPAVPPPLRLRRRGDFLAAARGVFRAMPAVVVQMRKRGDEGPARIGFTATKRIGKAVRRNRARRRLKEAVRLLPEGFLLPGRDYVFIARDDTAACPFQQLMRQLRSALKKLNAGEGHKAKRMPRRDKSR